MASFAPRVERDWEERAASWEADRPEARGWMFSFCCSIVEMSTVTGGGREGVRRGCAIALGRPLQAWRVDKWREQVEGEKQDESRRDSPSHAFCRVAHGSHSNFLSLNTNSRVNLNLNDSEDDLRRYRDHLSRTSEHSSQLIPPSQPLPPFHKPNYRSPSDSTPPHSHSPPRTPLPLPPPPFPASRRRSEAGLRKARWRGK